MSSKAASSSGTTDRIDLIDAPDDDGTLDLFESILAGLCSLNGAVSETLLRSLIDDREEEPGGGSLSRKEKSRLK